MTQLMDLLQSEEDTRKNAVKLKVLKKCTVLITLFFSWESTVVDNCWGKKRGENDMMWLTAVGGCT